VLTVVGWARIKRPWYPCPHCHQGQFPADAELDIEHTDFSPGVRRMQALVGQEAPFDHGREGGSPCRLISTFMSHTRKPGVRGVV
jgi:hypothetical protein